MLLIQLNDFNILFYSLANDSSLFLALLCLSWLCSLSFGWYDGFIWLARPEIVWDGMVWLITLVLWGFLYRKFLQLIVYPLLLVHPHHGMLWKCILLLWCCYISDYELVCRIDGFHQENVVSRLGFSILALNFIPDRMLINVQLATIKCCNYWVQVYCQTGPSTSCSLNIQ